MSFCINCGKELKENQNYCSNCGTKVNKPSEQPNKVMKCFTVFGNVGYTLGIVTLIIGFIPFASFYAWIVGIHGIVFSCLGKKDTNQLDKCQKGLRRSIAGTIIGIAMIILTIFVLISLMPN